MQQFLFLLNEKSYTVKIELPDQSKKSDKNEDCKEMSK